MNRHPSEAELALAAGRDLGRFTAWKIRRHTRVCDSCRKLYDVYASLAGNVPDLAPDLAIDALPPGINEEQWKSLAAEMQANIHLGLAAGACVAGGPGVGFREWKPVWAYAAVLALVAAGVWLQRPIAPPRPLALDGPVLSATPNSIELTQGSRTLGLRQNAEPDVPVSVSVGTQGWVRAQYVDQDSGYVVIQNVVQVQ
jgi:hypothetical protein